MHLNFIKDRVNIQSCCYIMETIGEGEVEARADEVLLTVGVMVENQDVKAAVNENANRIQRVLDALHSQEISPQQIVTTQYIIHPRYEHTEGKTIFIGFQVEHLLRITLHNISYAGSVYDRAIQNGANIARDLTFRLSDPHPFSYSALQAAYRDALQKATFLSQQMQVQINPVPVKLTESHLNGNNIPYPSHMVLSQTTTPIQPQTILIRARVQAWFRYVQSE